MLKKDAAKTAAPSGAAAFEQADTAVVAKPQVSVGDTAAATAGVAASTAVAKVAASALTVPGAVLNGLLYDDIQDAVEIEFGEIPKLVGSNGQIMDKDDRQLGDTVTVQIVSWSSNFVVSPGIDSAPKEVVKYSRDGISVNESGEAVAACLAKMQETYPTAKVKEYTSLAGILIESGKESPHKGNLVEVSLSPTSRKLFSGFRKQQTMKIRMGLTPVSYVLKLSTAIKSKGSDKYTVIETSQGTAAPVV